MALLHQDKRLSSVQRHTPPLNRRMASDSPFDTGQLSHILQDVEHRGSAQFVTNVLKVGNEAKKNLRVAMNEPERGFRR